MRPRSSCATMRNVTKRIPRRGVALGEFYLRAKTPPDLAEASEFVHAGTVSASRLHAGDAEHDRGPVALQQSGRGARALRAVSRDQAGRPPPCGGQKALLLAQNPNRRGEALEAIQRAIDLDERPDFIATRGFLRLDLEKYAESRGRLGTLRRYPGRS